MKGGSRNFESIRKFIILFPDLDYPTLSIGLIPTAMTNPVDRTIRLMALAAGVVSLLVFVVIHFI